MKCSSAVPSPDPVQQIVHDLVLQPIGHRPPDPNGAYPALVAEHPKSLGDGIFRPVQGSGQVTHADAGGSVQAEQDLQPVRIGEQIEAPGPTGGVDVGQGRRRTIDLDLITGLVHPSNLIQKPVQQRGRVHVPPGR